VRERRMAALPATQMHRSRTRWRRRMVGPLFVAPAFILYAVFMLYPFVQSIYLSLTAWDGAQAVKRFVGLANYGELIHDQLLRLSLWHNIIWIIIGTISPLVIGMTLALLLWQHPPGFTILRTIYFMPQVLSAVLIAIIWGWIYDPVFGILNTMLTNLGLSSFTRGWLGDPNLALYAVLVAAIWAATGFVFVILLAGLQNVNMELIDAAMIDGANAWQQFWNVTLPEMSNVVTVVTVLLLIGGFSVFDVIFVLTSGGPNNGTQVIATYTFQQAFTENRVGYGAALSIIMTILSLIVSAFFLYVRERQDV
jgi:ABC-type sugar transport system permease subunit